LKGGCILIGPDYGHSGQVSPIESSTSTSATLAAFGETPVGGSRCANSKARSRACGSVRSCIQPCSSHSRIAPTSKSTEIAHPVMVRIGGRRLVVASIQHLPGRIPGRSFRFHDQSPNNARQLFPSARPPRRTGLYATRYGGCRDCADPLNGSTVSPLSGNDPRT